MGSNSGEESVYFYIKSHPDSYTPLQPDYILDHYRSTHKFTLGSCNHLYIRKGKNYDLMGKLEPKRRLRCGCVKSNCEAKYCECYRAGQTCGEDCACIDCHNNHKHRKVHSANPHQIPVGCNCVKSGCLKKYCECFQRGQRCGPHCHCSGCMNCGLSNANQEQSE